MMLEKKIEAALVQRVKGVGGIAYKFTSPNRRSVPDRMVVLPGGTLYFVECKATGKSMTPAQARESDRLWALGQKVFTINDIDQIDGLPGLDR